MKNFKTRMWMVTALLAVTSLANAQKYENLYKVEDGRVLYNGHTLREVHVQTFQNLGYGYAKDRNNVYLDGEVLRYADPYTFRLQGALRGEDRTIISGRGHGRRAYEHAYEDGYGNAYDRSVYYVTTFDVYFNGEKMRGASANTFKVLEEGYAKDAFEAYYYGQKIRGANSPTFQVLRGGYAKDAFEVYFEGKKIRGADAHSFRYDGNGYAHDAFRHYYFGERIGRQ